jgi:hypothetical protein
MLPDSLKTGMTTETAGAGASVSAASGLGRVSCRVLATPEI